MAAGDGGPVTFVVHSPGNMASVPFSERLRCEVSEAFRPSDTGRCERWVRNANPWQE